MWVGEPHRSEALKAGTLMCEPCSKIDMFYHIF
jgi:hypothetical protein